MSCDHTWLTLLQEKNAEIARLNEKIQTLVASLDRVFVKDQEKDKLITELAEALERQHGPGWTVSKWKADDLSLVERAREAVKCKPRRLIDQNNLRQAFRAE